MRAAVLNWTALAALGAAALGFAADEEAAVIAPQAQEAVQVIDVVIVSSNRITVGSNTMSLSAATNVLALYRDTVDVIAIHGSIEEDVSAGTPSSAMATIARVGMPLVFVEKDGEYAWREQAGAGGVRTVKIGTDQFDALRRFWRGGMDDANASAAPVLQTSIDWDARAGTYEFKRIQLGLFGESVWLIHEQRGPDEPSGTIGIQFKKEW